MTTAINASKIIKILAFIGDSPQNASCLYSWSKNEHHGQRKSCWRHSQSNKAVG
jgi:hypothetical protein